MSDKLSQSEIDELLRQMQSGGVDSEAIAKAPEKKVKIYDFAKPDKFTIDNIKTLRFIYESYSRVLQNFLSAQLRCMVNIEVFEVAPMRYVDFTDSMGTPTIMAMVDMSPLAGQIIFNIAPNLAFALVDSTLGGRCSEVSKIRPFTDIELILIERITIQMLNMMRSPWENIEEISPRLEKTETNPQFAQITNPTESIILITLRVVLDGVEGMFNICIPYSVIEPVIPKLTTKLWFTDIQKTINEKTKNDIEQNVTMTPLPLIAVLGNCEITVGDFLGLQAGDVFQINTNVNDDLDIIVGEKIKFKARPGVKKGKVAIKITSVER